MPDLSPFRLIGVTLDERTEVRLTRELEHEREVAIYDLLEANSFRPVGSPGGPYHLVLGIEDKRLVFEIRLADGQAHGIVILSRATFRHLIRNYFEVCESYFKAIPNQPSNRIEALDMGRRSLHNEGAELLHERLKGKIEVDVDTARRLFTLICVLHLKG